MKIVKLLLELESEYDHRENQEWKFGVVHIAY